MAADFIAPLPANAAAVADGQKSNNDSWGLTAHLESTGPNGLRLISSSEMPVALMGNAFAGMTKEAKDAAMAAVASSDSHMLLNDIRQFKGVDANGALQVVSADVAMQVNGRTFMLERDLPGQEFWLFPGGMADRRLDETVIKELNEEALFIRPHPTEAGRFEVALFEHNKRTGITADAKKQMVTRLIEKLKSEKGLPHTAAGLAGKRIDIASLAADKIDIVVVKAKKDKKHERLLRPITQRIGGKNITVHAIPSLLNRLNNFGVVFPLTAKLPEPDSWAAVDGELFGRRAKMVATMADLADVPGQPVDVYERAHQILPAGEGFVRKPVDRLVFPDRYKVALAPLVNDGRVYMHHPEDIGATNPKLKPDSLNRRAGIGAVLVIASCIGLAGVIGATSWIAGKLSPESPPTPAHAMTAASVSAPLTTDACVNGAPVIRNPVIGDNRFTVDGLDFRFIDINPGTIRFDNSSIPTGATALQINTAQLYTNATANAYQIGRIDGSWRDKGLMRPAIEQSARNAGLCFGS